MRLKGKFTWVQSMLKPLHGAFLLSIPMNILKIALCIDDRKVLQQSKLIFLPLSMNNLKCFAWDLPFEY